MNEINNLISEQSHFFDIETVKEVCTLWSLKVLAALTIVIIGRICIKAILFFMTRLFSKTKVDTTLTGFIYNVTNISLQLFTYVAAISALGVETTSILAMMGAAGLAIGLALQGLLSSFASGVLIIFFRYLKKGDIVEIAGVKGTVKEVQIFNTVLDTDGNKTVIIPNNKITSDKIYIHNVN